MPGDVCDHLLDLRMIPCSISLMMYEYLVTNRASKVTGSATVKYIQKVLPNLVRSSFMLKKLVMNDKGTKRAASQVRRPRLRFCCKAFWLSSIDRTAVTTDIIRSARLCRLSRVANSISKSFCNTAKEFLEEYRKVSRRMIDLIASETRLIYIGNRLRQVCRFSNVTASPSPFWRTSGSSTSHSSCENRVFAYLSNIVHSEQTIDKGFSN